MTVGVVGLGLIGGSIGLSLRRPDRPVIGYDPSPRAIETALQRQCIDRSVSLEEVAKADIVFIASPPDAVVENLETIVPNRGPDTVVTDCASSKSDVVAWVEHTKATFFVPGHPMAGHEKTGAAFSSAWMFRHARWILCPLSFTDRSAVRNTESTIKEMGATILRMNASTHDRQVAILSHVPHVFAASLVLMGLELESADIAGGSWRDLTRVGGVDPELWSQILMANRDELASALRSAEAHLAAFRTALESGDKPGLKELLEEAATAKKTFEPQGKVGVPTKPRVKARRRP